MRAEILIWIVLIVLILYVGFSVTAINIQLLKFDERLTNIELAKDSR